MDELKKQRSFWKSLGKKDIITAVIITVLVILTPVIYFYPSLLVIFLILGFAVVCNSGKSYNLRTYIFCYIQTN